MIRKAHELVEVWRQIDGHLELSPMRIAYLCVFASGEQLKVYDVANRMDVLREKAVSHVHRLYVDGWIKHEGPGKYRISGKGLRLVKKLFPQTYAQEV
jgi:Mn-dependent DtxR family transcriptional regulator